MSALRNGIAEFRAILISMDKLRGKHGYKPNHCYFDELCKHYPKNAQSPLWRLGICHTVLIFDLVKYCVDFLAF
jgi:hypothetical protein